jgi:hypothetical protein
MNSGRTYWLLLAAIILLQSPELLAQRRTDILRLYNGDRVTGEIVSLQAGILTYKTDSMGTLSVEWQDIASLESRFSYEVKLSDGSRLFGSIVESLRPGQLRVTGDEGEHSAEWIEVVEVRPIEDQWTERLDVYLSANYNYTRASSVEQTTFNTEVNYAEPNALNTLTGRLTRSDNGEQLTSSSRVNYSRAVWTDYLGDFRAFWGSFESNDELGLDHRYAAGAGIGRFFLDSHRMRWTGIVGLQVLTERSLKDREVDPGEGAEGDVTETVKGEEQQEVEGVLNTRFHLWRFDTPELDISYSAELYPNLSDFGRLRGNTDLRLRWEIVHDLFWDISAWGTFDSEAESDNQWDYGITTGVGWSY